MKIVFFGDSLTHGTYGVSYVNKVAAALRGHHFINEGVNGDTSLNLYKRMERDVLDHRPDGALIMVGINDAVSHSEPGTQLYYRYFKGIHGGRITPIAFRENLRAVLTGLLFAQIRVWLVLPPIEYRPALVETLRQMNDYAVAVCAELHVPSLDLMTELTPAEIPDRPPMRALPDMLHNLLHRAGTSTDRYDRLQTAGGFTYSFDGLHLTERGAQRFADAIVPFLRANGVTG
jgi:lysophospholipase L1-like esterase